MASPKNVTGIVLCSLDVQGVAPIKKITDFEIQAIPSIPNNSKA